MSRNKKRNKTKGIIGLVAVLACAAILIAASNPIYEALSGITFLKYEEPAAADKNSEEDQGPAVNYGNYKPGTYKATVYGFESDVIVTVEVDATKIVSMKVNASGESSIGIKAAADVKAAVLAKQTAEVDAVSGATYTCKAVIKAIKTALAEASVK